MAKALEYPIVFKALLDGGYITSVHSIQKDTVYGVFSASNLPARRIGHITERQFDALMENGVIQPAEQRRIKGETIINFYHLPMSSVSA